MSITLQLGIIALEIVVLTFAAERFIYGATSLARRLHWPDFISGVIFLALGTSLPELMVAIMASHKHHVMLALGGVVGSNIANILLVLGVVTIISPLFISGLTRRHILLQAVVLSAASLLFMLWVLLTGHLSHLLGIFLLCGCAGYMILLWQQMRQGRKQAIKNVSLQVPSAAIANQESSLAKEQRTALTLPETAPVQTQIIADDKAKPEIPVWKAAAYWLFGLVLLLLVAHYLVNSVMQLGRATGVSEFVLGLTVIALGTSLPELAASIISAWNGRPAMVLGNVIGSNCFNLLAVVAVPSLFSPAAVSSALRFRDLPIMLAVTLLLSSFLFWRRAPAKKAFAERGILMGRLCGVLFLIAYAGYLTIIVLA